MSSNDNEPQLDIPDFLTQDQARAACEAGYLEVKDYIKLCDAKGWKTDQHGGDNPPAITQAPMRYLTVAECAAFGPRGHQNEVTPVKVENGKVLSVYTWTGHASGWREPRLREHGHPTYGRLVEAADRAKAALEKGKPSADTIGSALGLILCGITAYFLLLIIPGDEAMAATIDAPVIRLSSLDLALAWGVVIGVPIGISVGLFMAWCKQRRRKVHVPRDTVAFREWLRARPFLRHS